MFEKIQNIKNGKPPIIQPKLTIGQPDDQYEKEADHVAEKVMQMPESPPPIQTKVNDYEEEEEVIQMKPLSTTITPIIQKQTSSFNNELIQTKKENENISGQSSMENKLQASKGKGNILPNDTLGFMNRSFGSDFSDVKIHTDSASVQMNRNIGAKAFTHGKDIYFNDGKYNPSTSDGKSLIAHELTHTIQQKNTPPSKGNIQRAIDEKGSIRIIQYQLGLTRNGIYDNLISEGKEKLEDRKWILNGKLNDEKILTDFFSEALDPSITNQSKFLEELDTPTIIKLLEESNTAYVELEKNFGENSEISALLNSIKNKEKKSIKDKDQLFQSIPSIFEMNEGLIDEIKSDPDQGRKEEIENQQFGTPLPKVQQDLESNLELSNLYGNNNTGNGINLEGLTKLSYYKLKQAEYLIPKSVQSLPIIQEKKGVLSKFESWNSTELAKVEISDEGRAFQLESILAYKEITLRNLNRYLVRYNKNSSTENSTQIKNRNTLLGNIRNSLSFYLDIFLRVFKTFNELTDLYIKEIQDLSKYNQSDFKNKIIHDRKEKLKDEDNAPSNSRLIRLVLDHKNIDLKNNNIFTIHHDPRIDKMTKNDEVEHFVKEANNINGTEKVIDGDNLLGVILYERGNLKVVKLGVAAFDSPKAMEKAINGVLNMKEMPLISNPLKKRFSKKFDRQKGKEKYFPSKAQEANNSIFTDPRSVRVVLDLVNAPLSDSFSIESSDYIYAWQKVNYSKVNKSKGGFLREIDIEKFFNKLVSSNATNYNAAILLAIDFLNLDEELLKLKSKDFELGDNEYEHDQSEIIMNQYYKEDSLEKDGRNKGETNEAAVTSGSMNVPSLIMYGYGSFDSFSDLAGSVAHEYTHAKQHLGKNHKGNPGDHLFPYLSQVSGKFGDIKLPKNTLQYYDHKFVQGTNYYLELNDINILYDYKPIMNKMTNALLGQIIKVNFPYKSHGIIKREIDKHITKEKTIGQPSTHKMSQTANYNSYIEAISSYEKITISKKLLTLVDKAFAIHNNQETISSASIYSFQESLKFFKDPEWQFPSKDDFGAGYADHMGNFKQSIIDFYMAIKTKVEDLKILIINDLQILIDNTDDKERKDELDQFFKIIEK